MNASPAEDSAVQEPATAEKKADTTTPRLFWVGMALFMIVVVLTGFWPSYFGFPFSGGALSEEISKVLSEGTIVKLPWLIHTHAAIFGGWMILLLTQTILVSRRQVHAHMNLGRRGFLLGISVVALGVFLVFLRHRGAVSMGMITWAEVPLFMWTKDPAWISLVLFSILLSLGYFYRRKPEAHKRYMILATVGLVYAATDRMDYLLGAWCTEIMFVALVGPVLVYDLHTKRRIHSATLIGIAILGLFLVSRAL